MRSRSHHSPIALLYLGIAVLTLAAGCDTTAPPDSPHPGAVVLPAPSHPAAAEPAPAAPAPTEWPVRLDTHAGELVVYQPQPESFAGDRLTARAAVSLTRPDSSDPVFGSIWFGARVSTDRTDRTVELHDIAVTRVAFPNAENPVEKEFADTVRQEVPRLDITCSLDAMLTSLDLAKREKAEALELETKPPKVLFRTHPAVLVTIDGEPIFRAVAVSPGVMQAVNTTFVLLLETGTGRYFLQLGDHWMTAGTVTGPWAKAAEVPEIISRAAVSVAPPTTQPAPPTAPAGTPPPQWPADVDVIVSQEPAELVVTSGAPAYTPIIDGLLSYLSNTQSDVFLDVATGQQYLLLSGRWYHAASLQGPWTFVAADKLPPAFAQIPADSAKADVLPFVAGTTQAAQAKIDASIPQTSTIRRDIGRDLNVTYDGQPRFEPIAGTSVSYAANSPDAVIQLDGRYYCCQDAVWYESDFATGQWEVCVDVPPAIYTIPPSCPVYNVRYCYVYDYSPDWVRVGYLPGYTGCYVYGPCVVYGTGYYYPGWYGGLYIPRPWTWGFDFRFDLFTGFWGCGPGFFFGHPRFFDRHYHPGWWGPGGFHDFHEFRGFDRFDRFHDAFRGGRFPGEFRGGFRPGIGATNVYRRSENLHRNFDERATAAGRVFRGRSPGQANNVYAGHDGRVYRRSNDGWEERARNGNGWSRMNNVPEDRGLGRAGVASPSRQPEFRQPQRTPSDYRGLEADHFARMQGMDRARSFGGYRGGGGQIAEHNGFAAPRGGGGFSGGRGGGGFGGGRSGGGGHR